jgi:SWI/SNF-related matrix-associated actin-dependent regulator 1 of chromatin subfamily A
MSYEREAGTQMLAVNCVYCHRPLRDPDSLERGCGPWCAKKWGVFKSTAEPDAEAVQRALDTMPEHMASVVRPKLDDPRKALSSAIHAAGAAWEQQSTDAYWYIGSAMELARALGYDGAAEGLRAVFIEGRKFDENGKEIGKARPLGVVISDRGDRWEIELPYLSSKSVWHSTINALKSAGVVQEHSNWRLYFAPDRWLHVLNAIVPTLGGALGVMPSGEPFLVPKQPLPVPEDAAAPRGPAEDVATVDQEAEKAAREPLVIDKGSVVTLRDGREMVVSWISNDKTRLGLVTPALAQWSLDKYGYIWTKRCEPIWVGTTEVATSRATAQEEKAVEVETRAPLPPTVNREVPERMFPYQRESVMWLDQRGSGILALDMGLGKTACSLVAADTPIVVVCPASLRANWAREVSMWRPDLTTAVAGIRMAEDKILSGKSATFSASQLQADVCILGYEGLAKNLDALQRRGVGTLIVDEAHYTKELVIKWKKDARGDWQSAPGGSARAVNVYKLALNARRRFFLTGTPMVNGRPYELWPLLHMVDSKKWNNQKSFWKYYCDYQLKSIRGKSFPDYTGATNLSELREEIHGQYLLRKTKDELDLPEKWRQSKSVSLSADMAREYTAAAAEFLDWVRQRRGVEAARRASKSEVIVRLTALRRLAALGKVEALTQEILEHHGSTNRPLIVMAHHKEVIAALQMTLSESGLKVGTITGDDSPETKERNKTQFQDGLPLSAPPEQREYLDVLLCSITAAGVGLTLTRAQEMMMVERVWRPFDMIQAEDRIHRIGQRNRCTITYYDAPGTIDDRLRDVMAAKMAVAERLLATGDAADAQSLDFTDDLIDSIVGDLEDYQRNGRGSGRELPSWADPE